MARAYYSEDNGGGGLEFWKAEEVLAGFSVITDAQTLCKLHAGRYDDNRQAGIEYYNTLQAGLYLDILDGTYTVIEVVTLETYLKALASEIVAGSWLTAQNSILGMDLSGIFDQAFKDKTTNDINTYINENY